MLSILPNENISINKCLDIYNREEAMKLYKKNRKTIKLLYSINILLFLVVVFLEGFLSALPIVIVFAGIYAMRYSNIDKKIKKEKENMVDSLPELMDRVILLLSAGMYIEGTVEKIAFDFLENDENFKDNLLFIKLPQLMEKSKESNKSIIFELSEYAIRTGVRELIRFANILENSFKKGSDLLEKLELEGDLLWSARRKAAEEKARKAGTKLSFPLMLLLISLITITSAPMLMSI